MKIKPEAQAVLRELEERDTVDVSDGTPKEQRVRCVTRTLGELLHTLVLISRPKLILELGTSAGYSAIWMSAACEQIGARLISVEFDEDKVAWARANIERAGLQHVAEVRRDDAVSFINQSDESFDMVFMDHSAKFYVESFKALRSKIPPGGFVLVDGWKTVEWWFSVIALVEYREFVMNEPDFQSFLLPLEKGMMISTHVASAPR
jgi:predicted O-methyltransferase YrrM